MEPGIGTAGLCAFGAGACYIVVYYRADLPDWAKALLILIGTIFLVLSLSFGLDWLANHAAKWLSDLRWSWLAGDGRIALANVVRQMTPAQQETLVMFGVNIDVLSGEPAPVYRLVTGTLKIPMTFVEAMILRGNGLYFQPVGQYAEGTRERAWAQALTAHLITLGYAVRSVGNQPAAWMDAGAKQRGTKAIGL